MRLKTHVIRSICNVMLPFGYIQGSNGEQQKGFTLLIETLWTDGNDERINIMVCHRKTK